MIGRHLTELETPALCVDLNVLEANIQAVSHVLRESSTNWRPRVTSHGVREIAQMQLKVGAIGITAGTVEEAEAFVDIGVENVLIASPVVGERQLARVARLSRSANLIVACSHYVHAESLSEVCLREGVLCPVVIKLDVGKNQLGIRPGPDSEQLARGLKRLCGIRPVGIIGDDRSLSTINESGQSMSHDVVKLYLARQQERMRRDGFCCDLVGTASVGSILGKTQASVVTEIHAGDICGGKFSEDCSDVTGLQSAFHVLATVVNRPHLAQAVLNVGRRSMGVVDTFPGITRMANGKELTDASINSLSAEHAVVDLGPESRNLIIGDKVCLVPESSHLTNVLHSTIFGMRDDVVEMIWSVVR